MKLVAKMHSLGISHSHLHLNNIAVTSRGQIIILDLGKAHISNPKRKTLQWVQKKYIPDLAVLGESLAELYFNVTRKPKRKRDMDRMAGKIYSDIMEKWSFLPVLKQKTRKKK